MRFTNHYRCPDCGHEWQDEWSAMSDDDCPECGLRAIQPYKSDDTDEGGPMFTLKITFKSKNERDLLVAALRDAVERRRHTANVLNAVEANTLERLADHIEEG